MLDFLEIFKDMWVDLEFHCLKPKDYFDITFIKVSIIFEFLGLDKHK